MTKDEILDKLESVGIVNIIEEAYFLTEKYKELLENRIIPITVVPLKSTSELDYEILLNSETNGSDWDSTIVESKGRTRAVALMDCCNIPVLSQKGYRLRGLDKAATNIIGNIVESRDVDPKTFVAAITMYYKHTEMPKGFKNLLCDGDALDIYQEHIAGTLSKGLIPKDNNPQKWN